MPKYINTHQPSDVISITTFAVSRFPEKSAIIVSYKPYRSEHFIGPEIIEAMERFVGENNDGFSRQIDCGMEQKIKQDLAMLFKGVKGNMPVSEGIRGR